MHKSRTNRKKNQAKKKVHIELSPAEVARRTAENAAAKAKRYPHPPAYRYSVAQPAPVQPACYEFGGW